MPGPVKAVLFDWGETLVVVPNMITAVDQHMACLEKVYAARPAHGAALADFGVPWLRFRAAYIEATRAQIQRSHETRREHRFEDRFAHALRLTGVARTPHPSELAHLAAPFAREIVAGAQLVEGAAEVVAALARHVKVGVVSNYPHAPVVSDSLARFGLRHYFCSIVVSADAGWLKPHPDIYFQALAGMAARPQESVFVGDDLRNDVLGPKAIGLQTAWLTQNAAAAVPADTAIANLRELLPWVMSRLK